MQNVLINLPKIILVEVQSLLNKASVSAKKLYQPYEIGGLAVPNIIILPGW